MWIAAPFCSKSLYRNIAKVSIKISQKSLSKYHKSLYQNTANLSIDIEKIRKKGYNSDGRVGEI